MLNTPWEWGGSALHLMVVARSSAPRAYFCVKMSCRACLGRAISYRYRPYSIQIGALVICVEAPCCIAVIIAESTNLRRDFDVCFPYHMSNCAVAVVNLRAVLLLLHRFAKRACLPSEMADLKTE